MGRLVLPWKLRYSGYDGADTLCGRGCEHMKTIKGGCTAKQLRCQALGWTERLQGAPRDGA